MVYKARLLISGRQKIALTILALLFVGFLTNYPRVTEAILAFLLGGVVPGTNFVVSPDVILLFVVCAFVIGIVGSIVRMYFKAARSKRNFKIAVQSIESVVVLPVARDMVIAADPTVGTKARTAVRKRHASRMFITTSLRKIGHFLQIASGFTMAVLGSTGNSIKLAVVATAKATWTALRIVLEAVFTLLVLGWFGVEASAKFIARGTVMSARFTAKAIRFVGLWVVRVLRNSWQWAMPQLKKFDAWLELQFRKFENRAGMQLGSPDAVKTVVSMGREYKKSITDLHPKSVIRSARQKAVTIKPKTLAMPRGSRLKG